MTVVFVLYLTVSSGVLFGGDWTPLTEVGEFDTLEHCQQAVAGATYQYRQSKWKPYVDGAICIARQKKETR